jgi:hypothetical protein
MEWAEVYEEGNRAGPLQTKQGSSREVGATAYFAGEPPGGGRRRALASARAWRLSPRMPGCVRETLSIKALSIKALEGEERE